MTMVRLIFCNVKNNSNKTDEQETKVIYSVESMSLFDDLRKIPSVDYRRFAMEQKSEGARHINTVAGNHLAKLFDHHCSSWEMVLNPHPSHHPVPPVVRTDLYQGPERARHQCPAVSSANVCSTNKLNSRLCFTIARLCFTI